jgi:hypothetical protein
MRSTVAERSTARKDGYHSWAWWLMQSLKDAPRGVHTAIGVMAGVALERTVRALLQSLGFEKIVIEWKR